MTINITEYRKFCSKIIVFVVDFHFAHELAGDTTVESSERGYRDTSTAKSMDTMKCLYSHTVALHRDTQAFDKMRSTDWCMFYE